jgi:hypothetical protein
MIRSLKLIALFVPAAILAACELPPPNSDEISGIYRLDGPDFAATIIIKQEGVWEYKFESAGHFERSGQWSREPQADSASTIAITLDNFVFGFQFRPYPRPDGPTTYVMNLEKDNRGRIKSCLTEDNQFCFRKQQ